jgi:hypothetical protein
MFTNLYIQTPEQKKAELIRRDNERYQKSPYEYVLIDAATGLPVGDGKPMQKLYAEYVLNIRDIFKSGEFYLRPV